MSPENGKGTVQEGRRYRLNRGGGGEGHSQVTSDHRVSRLNERGGVEKMGGMFLDKRESNKCWTELLFCRKRKRELVRSSTEKVTERE